MRHAVTVDPIPDPVPLITVRLTLTTNDRTDLTVLSHRCGLSPGRVWLAGEERISPSGHRYPKPYSTSGWSVKVGPRRTYDLPGMLRDLANLVEPGREALLAAARGLGLDVEVSAHIKQPIRVLTTAPIDWVDGTPNGHLPAETVAWIAGLGADLDLDLYTVADDYDEPDAASGTHP